MNGPAPLPEEHELPLYEGENAAAGQDGPAPEREPEPEPEPEPESEPESEREPESARAASPLADAEARLRTVARKEYYSIGEVCELVDLKPHVLRYWETQFPPLNPSKNRSGNRFYQREEIRLVLLVRHLLYAEKYTIDGARQKLEQLRQGGELPEQRRTAADRELFAQLRADLHRLLDVLAP
jgi:DNA-binding transcriptional MerR regulator